MKILNLLNQKYQICNCVSEEERNIIKNSIKDM